MTEPGLTATETKLILAILRHCRGGPIETDWDKVAADADHATAKKAKDMWYYVKTKRGLAGAKKKGGGGGAIAGGKRKAIEDDGNDQTPKRKRTNSNKKSNNEVDDNEDDDQVKPEPEDRNED